MGERQVTHVLRTLMNEAYGACAWLEGGIILSERARIFKIKKLREALADAEMYLLDSEDEYEPGPSPRLP
jgi:hypothetical protein